MIRKHLQWLLILIVGINFSCASIKIQEKPIIFDETREDLSIIYMKERYGIETDAPTIDPRMIVIHWTAIPTLEDSYKAMHLPELPNFRGDIKQASPLNVSAHYLVDQDGTIYQLLPDTVFARHVIGLNYLAIGIENVGGLKKPLTKKQLNANTKLIRYLAKKHDIEYLIGHYEYQKFEETSLWKEVNDNYRTKKVDPGKEFMKNLRDRVKRLELAGPPKKIDPVLQ